MKVKEIICLVCDFVGEKELQKKLSTESPTFSEREQEKIDIMLRCFNLVNQEIASEYIPFLTNENISVKNSILNFSSLSKNLINVYSVKNRYGVNLKFKLFSNYIEIVGNASSITYSYLPDVLNIDDEVEKVRGLTGRIYAYGVASEYLLIDGISEDAEIWEERFKQSLFVIGSKKGEHLLPKRGWF